MPNILTSQIVLLNKQLFKNYSTSIQYLKPVLKVTDLKK